jgi:hypothetical protein
MSRDLAKLDNRLRRFSRRLPGKVGGFVEWLTDSSSSLVRLPIGLALIAGGLIGFLPILGFWMVPLGLVLIARDIPFLRRPMIGLLDWIHRKWPPKRESRASS